MASSDLLYSGDMSVETMLDMKSPVFAPGSTTRVGPFLLQTVSGRDWSRMTFSPSGRSRSTAHSMSCGLP